MNVDVPLTDGRRIEVLANGLLIWQGAQAAVDTTLVSPVTRAGDAQPHADRVADLSKRRNANACALTLNLQSLAVANWLCWALRWAAGSAERLPPSCDSWPKLAPVSRQRVYARPCNVPRCTVGRACWRWRPSVCWPTPSSSCEAVPVVAITAGCHGMVDN